MEKKKKQLINILLRTLTSVMIMVIAFGFILKVSIQDGNSMFPAIRDGDLLIAFQLDEPARNDVVIYQQDGITKTGRVIAISGETVEITEEGILMINSIQVGEEIFYATYPAETVGIKYPYIVPDGSYFILNDFRSDASDSRTVGGISKNSVYGSIIFAIRRRGF